MHSNHFGLEINFQTTVFLHLSNFWVIHYSGIQEIYFQASLWPYSRRKYLALKEGGFEAAMAAMKTGIYL